MKVESGDSHPARISFRSRSDGGMQCNSVEQCLHPNNREVFTLFTALANLIRQYPQFGYRLSALEMTDLNDAAQRKRKPSSHSRSRA
jgi:hypothetical protein